jgi:hypothetical protein
MRATVLSRVLGLLLGILCLGPTSAAHAQRAALVIANSAYAQAPLPNTVPDASLVASTLHSLGFAVSFYKDLDLEGMKEAVRAFSDQLNSKDAIGFFYYAGHAIQVRDRNYLVPIGASIEREHEVESEAFDFGRVLTLFNYAGNQLNVAVLDACRNNPFRGLFRSQAEGLAGVSGPIGSLIAYSTSPGAVAADDRSYATSLSHHLSAPGLAIETVFRNVARDVSAASGGTQVPWYQSSVLAEFTFREGDGVVEDDASRRVDNIVVTRRVPPPAPEPIQPRPPVCRVHDVRPPDDWLALRSEPSTRSGRQLSRLRSGVEFVMLGERVDSWYLVEVSGTGEIGWLSWATDRWIQC